jgi:uncharacterized protein (UPF0303 family)
MPNQPNITDAATLPCGNAGCIARFVAVGQGAAIDVKSAGVVGRITIGGVSSRIVIRVGVTSP